MRGDRRRAGHMPRFPIAFRLPAFASRVIHFPLGVRPPSRSAHRHVAAPDHNGVPTFHTHEMRPGRVPPVSRGRRCSPDRQKIPGRRLPFLNGQPLHLAVTTHQARLTHNETSNRGSLSFTHPVCPLPVTPGWSRGPSAFPRASHPAVASDARRGWGQATEHGPGTTQPA